MKCAILCGGLGTRMGAAGASTPKVLFSVGGQPLLAHFLQLLEEADVSECLLLTGHLSESIEDYVRRRSCKFPVTVIREPRAMGTAGAVKAAQSQLGVDDFLVLYGDVMTAMNLRRFVDFHRLKGGIATIVVHPNNHPYDSDLVERDQSGRVLAVHATPHPAGEYYRNLVNAGPCVLSAEIFARIPSDTKLDLAHDLWPRLAEERQLFGYASTEYLRDAGTPERLSQVNADWNCGRIGRSDGRRLRPAIFLDRDGVLNENRPNIATADDLTLLPGVGQAVRRINESGCLAVVVTNQPVVAKGFTTLQELDRIHRRLETLLGMEGAYLDAIYVCPHHPERGHVGEVAELKVDCDCRKPKAGLVETAMRELDIDPARSLLIGDSPRDFQCAAAAGLPAFGVKTGENWAIDDGPLQHFPDLMSAVEAALTRLISPNPGESLAPSLENSPGSKP